MKRRALCVVLAASLPTADCVSAAPVKARVAVPSSGLTALPGVSLAAPALSNLSLGAALPALSAPAAAELSLAPETRARPAASVEVLPSADAVPEVRTRGVSAESRKAAAEAQRNAGGAPSSGWLSRGAAAMGRLFDGFGVREQAAPVPAAEPKAKVEFSKEAQAVIDDAKDDGYKLKALLGKSKAGRKAAELAAGRDAALARAAKDGASPEELTRLAAEADSEIAAVLAGSKEILAAQKAARYAVYGRIGKEGAARVRDILSSKKYAGVPGSRILEYYEALRDGRTVRFEPGVHIGFRCVIGEMCSLFTEQAFSDDVRSGALGSWRGIRSSFGGSMEFSGGTYVLPDEKGRMARMAGLDYFIAINSAKFADAYRETALGMKSGPVVLGVSEALPGSVMTPDRWEVILDRVLASELSRGRPPVVE